MVQKNSYQLSIIIPCYNDETRIANLNKELKASLKSLEPYQLVLVDDGSRDETLAKLEHLAAKDKHVTAIGLRRNFGQHSAILAALPFVAAPLVAVMDSDLDVSPGYLPEFITKIKEGYDVVVSVRVKRKASFWRLLTSNLTRWLINNALGKKQKDYGSMFRLYRREVLVTIARLPEKKKFLTILTSYLGYRIAEINVATRDTKLVRKSRYSLDALFGLFFDIVTGYTAYPIRAISYLGIVSFFVSLFLAGYLLYFRFFHGAANNLMSFVAVLIFMNGLLLLSLGILGEYITRIYRQVLDRPESMVRTVKSVENHKLS